MYEANQNNSETTGALPLAHDGIDGDFMQESIEEEKKAVARLNAQNAAEVKAKDDVYAFAREAASGMAERADLIVKGDTFFIQRLPDTAPIKSGDGYVSRPKQTDMNRWAAFKALFGSGDDRPHLNLHLSRIVDHKGAIIDEFYPVVDLVEALSRMKIQGEKASVVREALREWALACQWNDLTEQVRRKTPKWDGTPRMREWLIRITECFDTQATRDVSEYFALALYGRVMHPGCFAPIVLSIIGNQNAGKSYLAAKINSFIVGHKVDASKWDLSLPPLENLRNVTGGTPIVSIPELGGIANSELKTFNSAVTNFQDQIHFKFEGVRTVPRQFLFLMDGNRYQSIHRDPTGNRRVYCVFAGQIPDVNGQPAWKDSPWKMDEQNLTENYFWQVMAEAAHFWETKGQGSYNKLVARTVETVAAYNKIEVRGGRGTMGDEVLDSVLPVVLPKCKKRIRLITYTDPETHETFKKRKLVIEPSAIKDESGKLNGISTQRITEKMELLGAIKISGKATLYVFPEFGDEPLTDDDRKKLMGDGNSATAATENAMIEDKCFRAFNRHVSNYFATGFGVDDNGIRIEIEADEGDDDVESF